MDRQSDFKSKIIIIIALLVIIVVSVLFFTKFFGNKNNSTGETAYYKVVEFNGKQYQKKDNIETFLLIGTDTFKEQIDDEFFKNNGQADFLMLIVLDKNIDKYYGIHINRDTMTDVRVLGVGGKVIKTEQMQVALSHAYGTGSNDSCLNTVRAVSHLLDDITIDHYIAFTMDAVPVVNDYIGGVEVELMDDFTDTDETMVQGATITLSGNQALAYVRERMNLENDTNVHRMERQRQYLNSMIEKMKGQTISEGFVNGLFDKIEDSMVTDYTVSGLQSIFEKIQKYSFDSIKTISGENTKGEEFMEFYPDSNAVTALVVESFYSEKK